MYWWPRGQKLIFLKEKATPEYWERQWQSEDWIKQVTRSRTGGYWFGILKKYLPDRNSRILEGGCGDGHLVDAMKYWGYDAIGIDFASETVKKIKETMPDLDVRCGDVRKLDFPDGSFDGYFSLGVIEHFWDGYTQIVSEMYRVLKPGGYVFLSFPCISPLDRVKIFFSGYSKFTSNDAPDDFFQFGLDIKAVREDFEQSGFRCLSIKRQNCWGGLQRLFAVLGQVWAWQNKLSARSRCMRLLMSGISFLLAPLCGHSAVMILQKC